MWFGKSEKSKAFLKALLKQVESPVVPDDALNILAEDVDLLELMPPKSVLTPHPKELQRPDRAWENDFDKPESKSVLSKI